MSEQMTKEQALEKLNGLYDSIEKIRDIPTNICNNMDTSSSKFDLSGCDDALKDNFSDLLENITELMNFIMTNF